MFASGDLNREAVVRDRITREVNGTLWDPSRPLEGDCQLKWFTFDTNEGRDTFWHSSAHILGESFEMEYGCKPCIGPCTTRGEGFYYDAFYDDVTLNDDAVLSESVDVGRGRGSCVLDEASVRSIEDLTFKSIDEDMAMSSKPRLQFFVRTFLDGRTIVIHGSASDIVESVQRQIQLKTGLSMYEQRLIYGGKQLQHDQTLGDCHVVNDAILNLVARMRSTALPQSWQLVNDFVSTVRSMCMRGEHVPNMQRKLNHLQDSIRNQVKEFLKMATKTLFVSASVTISEHMQVFQLAGATSALIMLLLAPLQSNRECAEESIKLFLSPNEDFLPSHIHIYCAPILLEFCKLLAKSVPGHDLYTVCRNALASLLDTIGVAHGSQYFNEAKAETLVMIFWEEFMA